MNAELLPRNPTTQIYLRWRSELIAYIFTLRHSTWSPQRFSSFSVSFTHANQPSSRRQRNQRSSLGIMFELPTKIDSLIIYLPGPSWSWWWCSSASHAVTHVSQIICQELQRAWSSSWSAFNSSYNWRTISESIHKDFVAKFNSRSPIMNTIWNGVMNTSQFLRSSQIVSLYSNYWRPTVYSINRGGGWEGAAISRDTQKFRLQRKSSLFNVLWLFFIGMKTKNVIFIGYSIRNNCLADVAWAKEIRIHPSSSPFHRNQITWLSG